jgi:hypothetical protein
MGAAQGHRRGSGRVGGAFVHKWVVHAELALHTHLAEQCAFRHERRALLSPRNR